MSERGQFEPDVAAILIVGLPLFAMAVAVCVAASNLLFDPFTGAPTLGPRSREAVCAEYHAGRLKDIRRALFGWNGCPEKSPP